MNFFIDLIKRLFAPIPQDDQPVEKQDKYVRSSDSFALLDNLLNNLGTRLRELYGGRRDLTKDCTLLLWMADDNVRKVVEDSHDRILNFVRDDVGFPIVDVKLMSGDAPNGATHLYDNIAFTLSDKNNMANRIDSATIRIHEGRGTLMQSEYLLNTADEKYEIGRGLKGLRTIGIVADSGDPNYDKNKFVRSHHAFIEFHKKYGFCLVVQRDGSRILEGSRTQIKHKDGRITELDTLGMPVPLTDGDVIILGKNVELEFSTLKQ